MTYSSLKTSQSWTQPQRSTQRVGEIVFVTSLHAEVLGKIQGAGLHGLVVPDGLLERGKKSFCQQPNLEEMKHASLKDTIKSIEIKFYPYLDFVNA